MLYDYTPDIFFSILFGCVIVLCAWPKVHAFCLLVKPCKQTEYCAKVLSHMNSTDHWQSQQLVSSQTPRSLLLAKSGVSHCSGLCLETCGKKKHLQHCHTGSSRTRTANNHRCVIQEQLSSSCFKKVESEVAICSSSSTSRCSFPDCKVPGILDLSCNFKIATFGAFEAKQSNAGLSFLDLCREPALWSPLTLLQMVCDQDDVAMGWVLTVLLHCLCSE